MQLYGSIFFQKLFFVSRWPAPCVALVHARACGALIAVVNCALWWRCRLGRTWWRRARCRSCRWSTDRSSHRSTRRRWPWASTPPPWAPRPGGRQLRPFSCPPWCLICFSFIIDGERRSSVRARLDDLFPLFYNEGEERSSWPDWVAAEFWAVSD